MTMILAICVAVTFAVSIYLMLGRELKGIAMGVFLLGHSANLSIIAMSGSPILPQGSGGSGDSGQPSDVAVHEVQHAADGLVAIKAPPILPDHAPMPEPLAQIVDPLPQALILTAIVIGFGVMAFLLTLIVVTSRRSQTLEIADLATPRNPDHDTAGGPTQG